MNNVLARNGITPPATGHHRTTCPQCSDYRKKRGERCMNVWQDHGLVWWKCHHCKWESSDVLEDAA